MYKRQVLETSIAVTSGSGGTNLGTARNAQVDCVNTIGTFNNGRRRAYGSNHWGESAIRQWRSSAGAANAWWQRQTIFDMPASYANVAGFLNGIDPAFLAIVGEVDVVTAYNTAVSYTHLQICITQLWQHSWKRSGTIATRFISR